MKILEVVNSHEMSLGNCIKTSVHTDSHDHNMSDAAFNSQILSIVFISMVSVSTFSLNHHHHHPIYLVCCLLLKVPYAVRLC